jgi:hypothetical protein
VDAEATEDGERLEDGNFAIRKLDAIRVHIHEHANDVLLTVHDGHAEDALGLVRNVLADAADVVLRMVLEPLDAVVDVEDLARFGHVLCDLSEIRAVDVLDGGTAAARCVAAIIPALKCSRIINP